MHLCLVTVTFCDVNVVWCYVLSQYRRNSVSCSCYLFYGEINTWYYCWCDSASFLWHLLTAVLPLLILWWFNTWYYCQRDSVSCWLHLLTVVALVTYFMVNSIPGIIAEVTLSLAPVTYLWWIQYLVLLLVWLCLFLMTFAYRHFTFTYFVVNSIPGIIASVTLSLVDDIAYRRCTCYLFYGEFNTWYYCWRDSTSCWWHLLIALYLLLILWCQYLVLLLAWLCLFLMTFAYRCCSCYLCYGEFNWQDSVFCWWHLLTAVVPVTNFMVSIPGIIAGVTLSLADEGQRYSYGCVPKPSYLKR